MAKQAPNPIDVQDFQFKLHCRLKVFSNTDNSVFNTPCNLIANSSRFGLLFIGTSSPNFQVILISRIENCSQRDGEITNYTCRIISIPSPPKHLSVNCDSTKLAVVIESSTCPVVLIYDLLSFFKQEVVILHEIRLSTSSGVLVTETTWNPTIANIFTACKSDGTLGLYELKETGIEINELPAESQALCMCWSPKGKQLAVGSSNGKIVQYKPDLKAAKSINAPPLDGIHSVVAIQWISSFQFIVLYKSINSEASSVLVVDAPKAGDVSFTNYEDICYSYGNIRPVQFYIIHQSVWNILLVASSNSMEVGVLGNEKEQWTQWILADSARAELPLSSTKQETLPIGLSFDTSAVEPVVWGEHSLPPAPFLFLLSHYGVLCCFKMINIRSGVSTICGPPEVIPHSNSLSLFTSIPQPEVKNSPLKPEIPKENIQPSIPFFQQQSSQPKELSMPVAQQQPSNQQKDFSIAPFLQLSKDVKIINKVATLPDKPLLTSSTSMLQQPITSQSSLTIKPTTTLTPTITNSEGLTITPISSATVTLPSNTLNETKIMQETDKIISKLICDECEVLEKELQVLLHKGNSLKIELGTDPEAVQLVQDTDSIQSFLKEVVENGAVQADEVHSLKQGLIQTWAWFEEARSRYMQMQETTLDTLYRVQQLDPVSQRYLENIQYLTYYLESQIIQANRVLDEQWENFQDSCKKSSKLQIPSIEKIYHTMVRQSAIHQKQKYLLKDISNRICNQRSKMNGRSLFISLNNVDQLEKDLIQLQLDPENILYAQYERVAETQKKLTPGKINKLGKMLLERDITHISVNKPQLSNTSLQTLLNNSSQVKQSDATVLGAAFSPIPTSKLVLPIVQSTELIQSTPKLISPKVETKEISIEGTPKGITSKEQPDPTPINSISLKNTSLTNTGFGGFKIEPNITKPFSFSTNTPLFVPSTSSFAFSFAPSATKASAITTSTAIQTTSTTTSVTTQFIFGGATPTMSSPFTMTKPLGSNISKSPSTTTELNKQSSVSSAFVPTTQLAFTFTAKSNSSTMPSLSVNTTKPVSTFIFSPATASAPLADNFASTSSKVSTPKTGPTNVTSTSVTVTPITSFKSPVFISSAPTPAALTVTPVSLTTTGSKSPSTSSETISSSPIINTPISSNKATTVEKPLNIVNNNPAFSFSSVSTTQSMAFTFKPSLSLSTSNQQTPFEFSKIGKDNSTAATTVTLFPGASDTSTTSGTAIVTSVKSVFSPVMTTSTISTTVTNKDANSPSPPKAGTTPTASIFASKSSTTVTSIFPSIQTSSTPIFKDSNNVVSTTTNIFGNAPGISVTAISTTQNIFGAAPSISTSMSSMPTFGAVTTTTSAPETTTTMSSSFGLPVVTNSLFNTTVPNSNSVFAPTAFGTTTNSVFPQPTTAGFPQTTTAPSIFAHPITTASSAFTSTPSLFTPKTTSSPFGAPANFENASAFDKPVFGTSPVFGIPTTTTTTTNIFGTANATAPVFGSNTSIFGNATAAPSLFAQSSTFSFSAAAANIPNTGFSKPSFSFGNSQQTTEGGAFSFNSLNMGTASTTTSSPMNSTFGQSSNANPFAKSGSQEPKPFGGGNLFGTPPSGTSSTSIFGGAANTGFGSPPAFGSQPMFGGNAFGQTPSFGQSSFGSSFGSPQSTGPFSSGGSQSVAQSGFGAFAQTQQKSPGFGGAPIFGGSPSGFGAPPSFGSGGGSSTFGASPTFGSKVFGDSPTTSGAFSGGTQQQSSTFANLANQNTLGFGALAQQSQPIPNQPPPFVSNSSFSTWR